jgi:hypothetical protein
MAEQKCDNCGKTVELMSDSNGGYRWYHTASGEVPTLECAVEGTAGLVATPKEKAAAAAKEDK